MSNSNKQAPVDPVMAFFRTINIIEQLSRSKMENALPGNMQASHFGVLSHLCRLQKTTTPAALADAFQVKRPSMTNTLQKLDKAGYIVMKPDPEDGRGKLVDITTDGIKAFELAIQAIGPVFEDTIKNVGMQTFIDVLPNLEKVRDYMDKNR